MLSCFVVVCRYASCLVCSYLVLLYSYISRHVDAYSYHVLLFRRQRCGQISSVQWRGDLQPRQPTWYDITMVLRIRMHSLRRKPTGTYIYRCTRRITSRILVTRIYTSTPQSYSYSRRTLDFSCIRCTSCCRPPRSASHSGPGQITQANRPEGGKVWAQEPRRVD